LGLAGLLEIAWAVGIRYTENWSRLWPSVLVVVAYVACLYLLSVAMRHIPAGTAYAVWVGIGTVGVVLWGILFFGESVSPARLACIGLILAGVIGLKLVS
jgi:quaternary ammonium compound-resistance protein SugE